MSLRRNVLASGASQFFVTALGLAMVPVYVRYLGAEAYGLLGFFAMLQAWFQLLDVGLSSTIGREAARFHAGALRGDTLRRLLHYMEGLFVSLAGIGACALFLAADLVADRWLKAIELSPAEIADCVRLMSVCIALRLVCGLYRSLVSGMEQLVWLAVFNSVVASCRYLLVWPLLVFVTTGLRHFFTFQLLVALAETAVLMVTSYRLLRAQHAPTQTDDKPEPVGRLVKFSLTLAFTSAVWTVAMQVDKLILSKLLSLPEYGYFTMAVLAAGGVMLLGGPISTALMPRLTRLHAQGDSHGLLALYRKSTRAVAAITFPAGAVLALFPHQVLFAWTGNPVAAASAADVLSLYAMGNAFLAMTAFPFFLQYAKGDVRLHLLGIALLVSALIPGVWWATLAYGAFGAGCAWLLANFAYLIFWTPVIHRRLAPGLQTRWLLQDVGGVGAMSVVVASAMRLALDSFGWPEGRWAMAAVLFLVSGVVVALTYGAVRLTSLRGRALTQPSFT